MADVTAVPDVTTRRRIRAPRQPVGGAHHGRRTGARPHHDLVGSPRFDGIPGSPGVPCRGRTFRYPHVGRRVLDALRGGDHRWPRSSSGTATSATSRSMPSSTRRALRSGCRRASAAPSSTAAATPSSSRPCARDRLPSAAPSSPAPACSPVATSSTPSRWAPTGARAPRPSARPRGAPCARPTTSAASRSPSRRWAPGSAAIRSTRRPRS